MQILVTGANGMLGQDLCPILEDNGYSIIETDINNLDITDSQACENFLKKEKPEIVIHCAAYTNVDKAESDLVTATRINVKGTENIAKACEGIGAVLVYISTDYVFDGEKSSPYTPDDKPNPLNNYGLTKLQGEKAVKKYCKNYYIVRTSWLYGHYGKNFVETMLAKAGVKPKLACENKTSKAKHNDTAVANGAAVERAEQSLIAQAGKAIAGEEHELKVVDDQIGCPTWTVELANCIVKLIEDEPCGTYHVCGSGHTSWYGFAEEIFKLEGMKVNLKPCSTEEFPRPAKRPGYSVMENNKICRNWKLALKDYLALRLDEEF